MPPPLAPLWDLTAPPLAPGVMRDVASLRDESFDAIVVGAGIFGLSTALHLAAGGARVAVLERDAPGAGTSGKPNGQVIAGFQRAPEEIVAAFGPELGERMIAFAGAAPDLVFDLVAKHRIECDARRTGWIQAARHASGMRELESIADSWRSRGAPTRVVDRAELARLLGTDLYVGGWLDARDGSVQPLAYVRGLAAACASAGVAIFGGVDVRGLARSGDAWEARGAFGVARAPAAIVATNVYSGELRGPAHFLGRAFVGLQSVQLATGPLPRGALARILPRNHACADTSHVRLRYFRLDGAGRFVIGGPGYLGALSYRVLERSARRMFPELRDVPFEHRWAARDTLTPDMLPHLYEPAAGLFGVVGFNGRGIAMATALGALVARRVLGAAREELPFPTTAASPVPLGLAAAARFWLRQVFSR